MALPTDLGLIISVPSAADESYLAGAGNPEPTIRVQMETLGGTRYFASLNVTAAQNMLLLLANWPPMQDFLLERGQREPPRRQ
jgi:hypothetical protein